MNFCCLLDDQLGFFSKEIKKEFFNNEIISEKTYQKKRNI
jgi:hypothetical protein